MHGNESHRALGVEEDVEQIPYPGFPVFRPADEIHAVFEVREWMAGNAELHELDFGKRVDDLLPSVSRIHLRSPARLTTNDDYPIRAIDERRSFMLFPGHPDIGSDIALRDAESELVLDIYPEGIAMVAVVPVGHIRERAGADLENGTFVSELVVDMRIVIPDMHGRGGDTDASFEESGLKVSDSTSHHQDIADGLAVLEDYLLRRGLSCGGRRGYPGVVVSILY